MKKRVLIVIQDRPEEGFRVADGLSFSEELDVTVLVCDAVARALSDEENPHLVALRKRKIPILKEGDSQTPTADVTIQF